MILGMNDGKELVEERHQKQLGLGCIMVFFLIAVVLNLVVLPVSFFIGGMATDSPGSGIYEFIYGFLYIQGIPLVILLIGVLMLINSIRKKNKK